MKVLVVDDSKFMLNELEQVFTRAGWETVSANDGYEGLDTYLIEEESLDAMILDYNMPGMNGIELLEKIRELESKQVPVFFLTTETNKDMREKASKLGAKAWIIKPFTEDSFIVTLKKALLSCD